MVMVGYDHQDEEAVICVAYFKIICVMGVERRDKGSALFHIMYLFIYFYLFLKKANPHIMIFFLILSFHLFHHVTDMFS